VRSKLFCTRVFFLHSIGIGIGIGTTIGAAIGIGIGIEGEGLRLDEKT